MNINLKQSQLQMKSFLNAPEFETNCLLIVAENGELRRLACPFQVRNVLNVPLLDWGFTYNVQAVMLSKDGKMVYYIRGNAYFYYNFVVIIEL